MVYKREREVERRAEREVEREGEDTKRFFHLWTMDLRRSSYAIIEMERWSSGAGDTLKATRLNESGSFTRVIIVFVVF
jgi:hypothetical protein